MHTSINRKSVARKAGVSGSTVSRVLSGSALISEETKERVLSIAQAMGYVPNRLASLLAQKKTMRLGFVIPVYKSIPPFSRSYFPALLDGLVLSAEEKGYSVTIILDKKGDDYKDLPSLVAGHEVDGLILGITRKDDSRIEQLKKAKTPFVCINSSFDGCFSVDNNPLPGMRKAFEYILQQGHRKIAFISGDKNYQNAGDRLSAFTTLASEFTTEHTIIEGNFSKTSGYYCAGKILQTENAPTCIMTSSDREAIGVIEYCRDHSISVPEKISVIGFDNLDPAGFVHPALTTVDNPVRQTGERAAKLLIDILSGNIKKPEAVKLDTGFVVRQSSGKVI